MSLKYAVLAALIDGEDSGYDLAKRFDMSVANFWYALPQQIYAELTRMEREGLVTATTVIQERRPNKRMFALSDAGREALRRWIAEPSRQTSVKDELLIRLYAADLVQPEALVAGLEERLAEHEARLQAYEAARSHILKGRTEDEYLRTTRRVGPYLPLSSGIAHERASIAWCRWAIAALRLRVRRRGGGTGGKASPNRPGARAKR